MNHSRTVEILCEVLSKIYDMYPGTKDFKDNSLTDICSKTFISTEKNNYVLS